MALTIKEIPTLKSQAARNFVSKADSAMAKKGSVDFSKQIASSKKILEKAKF